MQNGLMNLTSTMKPIRKEQHNGKRVLELAFVLEHDQVLHRVGVGR